MKNRIISIFLTAVMILSLIPLGAINVSAADGVSYLAYNESAGELEERSCTDFTTLTADVGSNADTAKVIVSKSYRACRFLYTSIAPDFSFTVAYDANGGTGAPTAQTKYNSVELILSDVVPARADFSFGGWALTEDATEAQYQPGDGFTVDADVTLYAVWNAPCVASGECGDKGDNVMWTVDIDDGAMKFTNLSALSYACSVFANADGSEKYKKYKDAVSAIYEYYNATVNYMDKVTD